MSWIKTSEMLPELNKRVLIFTKNEKISIAFKDYFTDSYYLNSKDFNKLCFNIETNVYEDDAGYIFFEEVTHWMPLPESPKE